MFERHHGETICICKQKRGSSWNPRKGGVHHSQFYTRAHKEREQFAAFLRATAFERRHAGKFGATADSVAYIDAQRVVDNSIYKPAPGSDGRWGEAQEIKYHSLPSLVYELCSVATLLDIYTIFVTTPLLTVKAPHAKQGRESKKNAKLKKAC